MRGVATTDGISVEVKCPDQFWMTFRRMDDGHDHGFARFAGQEFGATEIGILLPNWRILTWTQIDGGDLSSGQWYARDGDYRINIYGNPGSSMGHGQVMGRWRRFMGLDGINE